MTRVVAFDPGRSKCGLLLADTSTNTVLQGKVIPSSEVLDQLRAWMANALEETAQIDELVIGDGTSSTIWQQQLPTSLKVTSWTKQEPPCAPESVTGSCGLHGAGGACFLQDCVSHLVISTPSQRS